MASWNRREVNIRHIEYTLRFGSAADEVYKALNAAQQEWERLNPGRTPAGDFATVDADDENIIIRIEVRGQAS